MGPSQRVAVTLQTHPVGNCSGPVSLRAIFDGRRPQALVQMAIDAIAT